MSSIPLEEDIEIRTAVTQKTAIASNGVYLLSFDKKLNKTMTYKQFAAKTAEMENQFEVNETDIDAENIFWESVKDPNTNPIYGIDNPISLFPDSCDTWNMNKLSGKDTLIHSMDHELEGILSPFLYIGMRHTAFAWHVEDSYLLSVNVLHQGAPKTWYSIYYSFLICEISLY